MKWNYLIIAQKIVCDIMFCVFDKTGLLLQKKYDLVFQTLFFTGNSPLSIPGMIAFSSIYGDIFPATILDGGYSVGGGRLAIIVGGHDQK